MRREVESNANFSWGFFPMHEESLPEKSVNNFVQLLYECKRGTACKNWLRIDFGKWRKLCLIRKYVQVKLFSKNFRILLVEIMKIFQELQLFKILTEFEEITEGFLRKNNYTVELCDSTKIPGNNVL